MPNRPTFTNTPNKKIITADHQVYWASRSCAVVGEVFLYCAPTQLWYVLMGQRGDAMPEYPLYWGLPCGYLDWDETLYQAMLREVFEETGLDLPQLLNHPDYVAGMGFDNPSPWKMSDDPASNLQNISVHFGTLFSWESTQLPPLSLEHAEVGEALDAKWIPLTDALNMPLAFSHSARLNSIWEKENSSFKYIETQPKGLAI